MGAKKKEPFTRAQRLMGIGVAMGSAFGVLLSARALNSLWLM